MHLSRREAPIQIRSVLSGRPFSPLSQIWDPCFQLQREMLTEGEQDASSQRTPPALSALAELRPKATRRAQSTADPARAPGPTAHLPTSCSHAAGQARSSRRATINCSSPCARPAPASMIAHIWRTDVKVVRLLFHAVGPAVDGGAAATRPTPRRLQLAYSCRTAADSRRMPCEPLPPTPRTTARGRSAVQRQLPAPRAALPAPHAAAGAVPAAPAAGLPPLRTAALSPRPPGQNGTERDGTGRGGGRRAARSRYDRPDLRDRALAHSQWHHPRWQHQCRRKQRPWLCVAQSESPSHGWKSGLPAQLRASA